MIELIKKLIKTEERCEIKTFDKISQLGIYSLLPQ